MRSNIANNASLICFFFSEWDHQRVDDTSFIGVAWTPRANYCMRFFFLWEKKKKKKEWKMISFIPSTNNNDDVVVDDDKNYETKMTRYQSKWNI